MSEFEGFFGQASFQTSNFLGRGESLTVSLSAGSRAQNYSVAFSEPFLFDRNMTGSVNVFRNDVHYVNQYTQRSTGAVVGFGYPLGGFTRMFTNYSYERVRVTEINAAYTDPLVLARNPFLRDSLLIGANGERIISKVTPSSSTAVDQPIFPNRACVIRVPRPSRAAAPASTSRVEDPVLRQNAPVAQPPRLPAIHPTGTRPAVWEAVSRRRVFGAGFDIRSIGRGSITASCSAATRTAVQHRAELQHQGQLRFILFFDAGQLRCGSPSRSRALKAQ